MTALDTEYATIPFFDYHAAGDKQCDACYLNPLKKRCGGLLHNHIETVTDSSYYVILWRCDSCGGDHQDEDSE